MQNALEIKEEHSIPTIYGMSRRRLLQLLGIGAAGLTSLDILAACGGGPAPVNTTPTPAASPITTSAQAGMTRRMPSYFLGYNAVPIHGASWHDANLIQAAQQLQPETLRYPGGTIANYWDWQTGWFLPSAPAGLASAQRLPYGLGELQIGVQATGATPLYVLNMLTATLDYQLQMLRTATGMGLPVQLIELGNEFYLPPQDYVAHFPSGQDYGRVCNTWIPAIRSEFPSAKIAIVGSAPDPNIPADARRLNWNHDVLQTVQGADALTLHPYVTLRFVQEEKKNPRSVAVMLEQQTVADPDGKAQVIGTFYSRWSEIGAILQSLPQQMEVWYTEYNLEDPIQRIHASWLNGVFIATMNLTFLDQERSTLGCLYDMIGSSGFEAVFLNESGFQGWSGAPATTPYALSSTGLSMRLLGEAIKGMASAQKLVFNPNPVMSGGGSSFPALIGWKFSNSDGSQHQTIIVNSSQHSFLLNSQSALPNMSQFQQLASDPLTIVTGPNSLSPTNGAIQSPINIPPYSVTQFK